MKSIRYLLGFRLVRVEHVERLRKEIDDLTFWGKNIRLRDPEVSMIKDALENRMFKDTVYEFNARMGYREAYEGLLAKIKESKKRREMI